MMMELIFGVRVLIKNVPFNLIVAELSIRKPENESVLNIYKKRENDFNYYIHTRINCGLQFSIVKNRI